MATRIKICGLAEPAVAQAAVAAGADAIGLIFHPPSRRCVGLDSAAAMVAAIGPWVASVAVLVNPSAAQVRAILAQVNPTCLQFHGDEPADFCAAFGVPYIKALRVTPGTTAADLLAQETAYAARPHRASGILLDADAAAYGGAGMAFDWRLAQYGGDLPLLLAGGLGPENVATAVAQTRPYGVDVSTGVETDGAKDIAKIRRFCLAVAQYDVAAAH